MVTVTDFDERREAPADRVRSWPGGERPSWREFRQAALHPDRQEGSRRPAGGGQLWANAEQVGVAGPRPL
jgi:hypothetical protein